MLGCVNSDVCAGLLMHDCACWALHANMNMLGCVCSDVHIGLFYAGLCILGWSCWAVYTGVVMLGCACWAGHAGLCILSWASWAGHVELYMLRCACWALHAGLYILRSILGYVCFAGVLFCICRTAYTVLCCMLCCVRLKWVKTSRPTTKPQLKLTFYSGLCMLFVYFWIFMLFCA